MPTSSRFWFFEWFVFLGVKSWREIDEDFELDFLSSTGKFQDKVLFSPPTPIFEFILRVAARHHLLIQCFFVSGEVYDAFYICMVVAHDGGNAF